ncbi:Crp/Fnr family transcriptional regulator [Nonlabens sp. MIC269]|uniref:Crp/Fnr family transcriptional regulator n=1 Tax=Nonlabens TaxID=363408 RepID=UPI0007221DA9|nr:MULTISPECIES: Crp/Fnr family transcriptional regulator [Nonlabens]ALM21727.1 Crp/Fnr family transcriptional regulator [Nonlabens sp. MIC269]ARN71542.1 Crp/Fnr family transcriptional regulator [Nonlabens tegetincola]
MNHHKESRCENCVIRQLNSLKALSKEQLKEISDSKVTKSIKKGEVIFAEGERLHGVFCVRNGVSKLSKTSENGKDQIVKIATKGEVLGQRSVITEESANLSAVALNDMEMCYIPKTHLINNINRNPKFTKAVLIQMADDLKFADDVIVNMAQKSVKQRIAETLMYLEKNFGIDQEGYISMTLTREDIANVVGTAKEACIRTLTSFKKEDWIITDGKRIKITDKNALLKLSKGF